jgi:D-beta-D-heptose 7-phosphate kinase/D-beta-D-heptose 1-phosphate adenosyltransferase
LWAVGYGRSGDLPREASNEKSPVIVFANGCFDLLHPGHLSLLEYCATIGYVVVGLNSDASVRRLKGPMRPIMNQNQRKYSLESCRFVDEVHIFEEDTPLELIKKIRPDFIVKGSEFRKDQVIGAEYTEVLLFTPTHDVSTTKILNRVTGEISHAD